MRTLFIIPLVLMSLVSFPSWGGAEEVTYECKIAEHISFFKVKKLDGETLILFRKNLNWERWCDGEHKTLEVLDEGGICHTKYHVIDANSHQEKQTTVFDFLLKTLVNETEGEKRTFRCKIID